MKTNRTVLISIAAFYSLGGCSQDTSTDTASDYADIVQDDQPANPPLASAQDQLAFMAKHGTFAEESAGDDREVSKAVTFRELTIPEDSYTEYVIGPAPNKEVCVLAGMRGDYDAGYFCSSCYNGVPPSFPLGYQGVHLSQVDYAIMGDGTVVEDKWLLSSDGYQSAAGSAICVPWSNWPSVPNGGVKWVSGEWYRGIRGTYADYHAQATLWLGDAASFLATVGGELEGWGEKGHIVQATSASANSVLHSESTNGGFGNEADFIAGAYSVFVGVPGQGRLVRTINYNTSGEWVRGTVNSSGTTEYATDTESGFSSYWLAPRDMGLCYLTYVGGDFNGYGESTRIRSRASQWFLESVAGGGKVRGRARCMAYSQA